MFIQKTTQLVVSPSIALWLLMISSNSCVAIETSSGYPDWEAMLQLLTPNQDKVDDLADTGMTGKVQQASRIFDEALQVAQTIHDQSQKVKTISAIALQLAEIGQTRRALQVFVQAVKLTEIHTEYYNQDEDLRDIVIQVAQVGERERALQWTQKIASGYRKAEALNGIAAADIKAGKLDQAKQTLLKALQIARGVTGNYAYESNGSCANYKFEAMAQIASNLAVVEQLKTALQVAQTISGCRSATGESGEDYQAWAFLGILGHLTKESDITQTLEAAKPIPNNHIEKVQILSGIGVKLAKIGDTKLALQVAKTLTDEIQLGTSLPEVGIKDKGLRDIATQLLAVGQVQETLQVAQSIQDKKVKESVLVDIAQHLAKVGQVEEALQLANGISDEEGKALSLIAIAGELNKAAQQNQAKQLLSQVPLPKISSTTYDAYQPLRKIAVALAKIGRFEQALQISQTITDKSTKSETLADIANKLEESGQLEQAFQVTQTIEMSNSKAETLANIVPKLTTLVQVERALQIVETIEIVSWKDTPKAQIVPKLVELGQTERAITVAQTIKSQSTKNEVLAKLANQLIKLRKTEQALSVAKSIEDRALEATTLANIAVHIMSVKLT